MIAKKLSIYLAICNIIATFALSNKDKEFFY
nr:MAG TPA: hypothetical protein [Caudoviricetes sp.]